MNHPPQPHDPWQPVVVQTAYLGDLILTTPLLRIASRAANAPTILVTRPQLAPLFDTDPSVDLFIFDKHGADSGASGLWKAAQRLRRKLSSASGARPVALLAQSSHRSAALALIAGVPTRLCHDDAEGRVFATATAPRSHLRPWDELDLLPLVPAVANITPLDPLLHHLLPASPPPRTDRVALAVGSARLTKRPPVPLFSELARRLADIGQEVVLIGSEAEKPLASEISRRAGCTTRDATGCSLPEAAALLATCRLTVGGDTGLLHLARAVGTDAVVIYGPTSPHPFQRPVSPLQGLHVPYTGDAACSPCSPSGPQSCPLGHGDCMRFDENSIDALWELVTSTLSPATSWRELLYD